MLTVCHDPAYDTVDNMRGRDSALVFYGAGFGWPFQRPRLLWLVRSNQLRPDFQLLL